MVWGPLRPLRGHLPLKGEDIVVLSVLPLQGEVPADLKSSGWVPRQPARSVSLDRVVRSVSVSEQSDESGTDPSLRRPPSPPVPRPDSRRAVGPEATSTEDLGGSETCEGRPLVGQDGAGPPPTASRPPPPEGRGHRRSHSPPPSGGGACEAGGGGPRRRDLGSPLLRRPWLRSPRRHTVPERPMKT